jgi:hypothetical protein
MFSSMIIDLQHVPHNQWHALKAGAAHVLAVTCPSTPVSAQTAHLAVDAVMDVGGPHAGGKQEQLVRQEVHGAEEEGGGVGQCLEHAIKRMEGKAGERRQGVLLVVLVVGPVEQPAKQKQGVT